MNNLSVTESNLDSARLKRTLLSAWSRTDELFNLMPGSVLLQKPIAWRHPFVFYAGHLPAFSWNQICGGILRWKSFNPCFDDLFCRGIDPDVDTEECHWHPDVPDQWPALKAILRYRDEVRAAILESVDVVSRVDSTDVLARNGRVFRMVLEHEYMHQETLLYMVQELPLEMKNRPPVRPRYSFQSAATCRPIEIPGGTARMGARFSDLLFGWDNEFAELECHVPAFSIDSMPVTNGEFFEFVQSGAYEDQRYWRPKDWQWKNLAARRYPNCWLRDGDEWGYRATFDVMPLSRVASWPVYASLAEARAYAAWQGKRLPTEAEFHRAAFARADGDESSYPWGELPPEVDQASFNFSTWSPTPVGCHPGGASHWGVHELVGNGWEWTDTPFAPFPGFVPYMTSYPDYSKDFFDGKHFVLKGASWATPVELVRPSFRNWFRPITFMCLRNFAVYRVVAADPAIVRRRTASRLPLRAPSC